MPALKVCSAKRCPELVRAGRCIDCDRKADRNRGNRGYSSKAWRTKRKQYLATHPFCERRACFQRAVDVNHLDGLGPNGPRGLDDANLEALCHSCHSKFTATYQPGGWNAR